MRPLSPGAAVVRNLAMGVALVFLTYRTVEGSFHLWALLLIVVLVVAARVMVQRRLKRSASDREAQLRHELPR